MTNIFERASRLKLRFSTAKGTVTVEELWDFPLETLDTLAQQAHKKLKEQDEASFIPTTTAPRGDATLQLTFDILKHVIETKFAEEQARKSRAETRQRLTMLKELEATKSNEALLKQPLSKIRQQREALEAELEEGL
mgnify:FL=1